MATCPDCGVSTRADPGSMVVSDVLVVHPGASDSEQAGKYDATRMYELECQRCGFAIRGRIRGEDFIGEPSTIRHGQGP